MRRPESVLVIVYTDSAEILLLKRKAPFEFWQSVTGSLESGEAASQAAARELAEETGLDSTGHLVDTGRVRRFTIDPRWRDRYAVGITVNAEYEWRYRVPEAQKIRTNPSEHSAWEWLPIGAAIETVWSWTNRQALEKLRDELL